MTVRFTETDKNARAQTVVDKVDQGSTNANGQLWLVDSGDNPLSKHDMANPAFGTVASGASTANAIQDATAILAGSVAEFLIVNRDEQVVMRGTVGAVGSGADMESATSSVTIALGENVVIGGFIYSEGS